MSVIFLLILVSLLVAGGFLIAFLWAVKSGQYEDDYSPAVRILFDDQQNPSSDNIYPKNNHVISNGTGEKESDSKTSH
ncbi:cbb3-type cytochrome oxidase assembly protein CcoS [bacterium SCSIO 12741]|nr:cbb3-type cytochrome oxidase assembly protein CcoS [bacterium SCSIO 12741]